MAQLKDLIVTGAGRIIGKLYASAFSGNGAEITSLNASNVSSGTLSSDRLPTVPVAKGGTGATDAAAARTNLGITPANIGAAASSHTHNYAGSSSAGGSATSAVKLATARTIQTNLGSTSTASFDGSANVTTGVTGTLPIANGGTGATTAAAARTNLGVTTTTFGRVYVGTTAPDTTTNTLWVDSSSGVIKYYNGEAWKAETVVWG